MGTTNSITFDQDETGNLPPEGQPAADPNRPEWLDPKFQSPEDLAKAYTELQAHQTRTQQELASLKKGTQPPAPPKPDGKPADPNAKPADNKPAEQPSQDDQAQQLADAAGVDLAPYQQEWATTGDVTVESREKIAKGLEKVLGPNARGIVDEYIEARKVVVENDTKMYMEAAGGQDAYSSMTAWAKENWTPEQQAAYNAQVSSGDRHATLFAIETLRAKYEASNGRTPRRITAQGGATTNQGAFRSAAEMTEAMKDPRYKADPAFRAQVAARLAASNF